MIPEALKYEMIDDNTQKARLVDNVKSYVYDESDDDSLRQMCPVMNLKMLVWYLDSQI